MFKAARSRCRASGALVVDDRRRRVRRPRGRSARAGRRTARGRRSCPGSRRTRRPPPHQARPGGGVGAEVVDHRQPASCSAGAARPTPLRSRLDRAAIAAEVFSRLLLKKAASISGGGLDVRRAQRRVRRRPSRTRRPASTRSSSTARRSATTGGRRVTRRRAARAAAHEAARASSDVLVRAKDTSSPSSRSRGARA